jgi:hypothetical protein
MSASAVAELRKLAHTLDVPPERLTMVSGLPAEDLRGLRTQVGEALFQADRHYFVRLAAVAKGMPVAVVAKLTEAVLPPLVAARTAELLEPHRAADLVARLSDRYLADVSVFMDASRAPEVVAELPPDRVAAVAAELARRQEWVVIGGFVAHVTPAALGASVARLNGEQLLRIGFVIDDLDRVDEIGAWLTDRQVDEVLAAAADFGLWAEVSEFAAHLAPQRSARLRARYAVAPDPVRAAFEAGALPGAVLDRLRPRQTP